MPERIADMLAILAIVVDYGRHLVETIQRRSLRRGFSTIAQYFGTTRLEIILAHLSRGIMRGVALERLLLRRAQRGRDLVILKRREYQARPPKTHDPDPDSREAAKIRRREPQAPLTLGNLPSMRQIEAEVRRRPIGATLVEISLDLAIAPSLCNAVFGNKLFDLFRWYGGSFDKYYVEIHRREHDFARGELDRSPHLDWPAPTRQQAQAEVGFFIGEPPVDPTVPSPPPAASSAACAPVPREPARPP